MSGGEESEEGDTSCDCCCASCGIAELDDIKLVPCDGCDLVKYCGDECRENHKSEHEEDCRKRAAELHDELLFKQPESSYLGDCPICSLPLPIDKSKSAIMGCCSKIVCKGCYYANGDREIRMRLMPSCPFCRKSLPKTQEEHDKQRMKRIEANDLVALSQEGEKQYEKGDHRTAFDYYTKAARLGFAEAHFKLALLYLGGKGVEKDVGKSTHHLEEAAIGGHPQARYSLGMTEMGNAPIARDRRACFDRAVKHFVIAATQGEDKAIKTLLEMFRSGLFSKEKLAAALRAHKAAVDATKSPQRKEVEE